VSHHEKPAEHPNAKLLRDMTAAFVSSDMAAMSASLTDDIEWHEIGRDDPITGKAALVARWEGMTDAGGSFSTEMHDAVANDDHGVALMTTTVAYGDKSLTYRTAEIYHFRDGKVSARWAFSDDTAAINEFFGGM
jgi:hypothetical protein